MLKEITQQAGFETISAHRMSNHGVKRAYFPGLVDIVVVTDPAEIRTISNDSRFDRDFILHGPVRTCSVSEKCSAFSRSTADYSNPCCRAPTLPALSRKTNCGRD